MSGEGQLSRSRLLIPCSAGLFGGKGTDTKGTDTKGTDTKGTVTKDKEPASTHPSRKSTIRDETNRHGRERERSTSKARDPSTRRDRDTGTSTRRDTDRYTQRDTGKATQRSARNDAGKGSSSQEFFDAKRSPSDVGIEQEKRTRKEGRAHERDDHVKPTFEDCLYVRCSQCKQEGIYVHAEEEDIVPYDPPPTAPPCQTCFQCWPEPSSEKAEEILEDLAQKGEERFGKHRWVCRKCKSGTDLGEIKTAILY